MAKQKIGKPPAIETVNVGAAAVDRVCGIGRTHRT